MIDQFNSFFSSREGLAEVEPGIYSVIPANLRKAHYDSIAWGYDKLVSNPLYNSFIWKTHVARYGEFAREVLGNSRNVLDIGCGSLSFTASAFSENKVPTVLIDRSLAMLRLAKKNLVAVAGAIPDHILLLQADLFHLPFKPKSFDTVVSFGMYHLFAPEVHFLSAVASQWSGAGRLAVNSLVRHSFPGDFALTMMSHRGIVSKPRTSAAFRSEVTASVSADWHFRELGHWVDAVAGK